MGRLRHDRRMTGRLSRRQLLHGAAGLGLAGAGIRMLAACGMRGSSAGPGSDGPLETTRLRMVNYPTLCLAPTYVAEELLRAEGFTDVQYQTIQPDGFNELLAKGGIDITQNLAASSIVALDAGDEITVLGGVHVGCYELYATNQVRSIRDLKSKKVAVYGLGTPPHLMLSSMAAYVGLDPRTDIIWEAHPGEVSIEMLAAGKVDAFLGFPPEPQELAARGIGHVVVNTAEDRPWSQYFCCILVGNREFVRKHPVATKRAMRAILKAADLCAGSPERAAQLLVDKGYTDRFDYASKALRDIHYNRWRDYDPEDTIRFYALRLQEIGMIKNGPKQIIELGTDFRIFNELKKELKA